MKKKVNDNPNYRIITKEAPFSTASENYRRIRVNLETFSIDKQIKTIQICSAVKSEGKTITLLNLAMVYAEENKKVVIIDLDFRRPKLHRILLNKKTTGISDIILNKSSLDDCINHVDGGFDLITSGSTKSIYPLSIIESDAMKELINELKNRYDYVLIDCPPILAVPDSAIIGKFTDGCLFVVSQKNGDKYASRDAVRLLRNSNINVLGCVFTEVSKKHGYYNSTYKYHSYNYHYLDED